MKINQRLIQFGLSLVLVGGLFSCKKAEDFVPENTTIGLGSYPVSANTLVDLANGGNITNNREYTAGNTLAFELQYWSDAPIKEINFYQTVGAMPRELLLNKPYAPSYSKLKSADTLVLSYTIPAVAATTNIRLEAEIVNENTLKVIRTLNIRGK
jgi:hypothetical protein